MSSHLSRPQTPLEIHIQCRRLPKKDTLSQSDPFCVIHEVTPTSKAQGPFSFNRFPAREPGTGEVEIGRTEVIIDTANPDFVTPISFQYRFEKEQILCVRVFDEDKRNDPTLRHHDYLGGFYCTVGQVLGSKGNSLAKPLRQQRKGHAKKGGPFCIIQAEQVKASNEILRFQLSGNKLANMDGLFSKSDPFYVWKRINPDGKTWNTVHKSEMLRNTLNPQWKPDQLSIQHLCNGDHNRRLQIQLVDWDRDGSHDDMGSIETTVAELMSEREGIVFRVTRKSRMGKLKQAGTLTFHHVYIEKKPTMLDYISGGCEISLMVAVDFTLSNGLPDSPNSLHFRSGYRMNEYQRAITKIGTILQDYDTDKLFPIWGFGAKINNERQACMPLMDHEVYATQGLLHAYNHVFDIPGFELSGPTNFKPVLQEALQRALRVKANLNNKQAYNVLVILTDGCITDMTKTVDKICEIAASAPLSIVIVGVGNADFSKMEQLDGDGNDRLRDSKGRPAARDIVQFVPFRQFGGNAALLAAETLKEVPDQLVQYFHSLGIKPNPPMAQPDFTEEQIFLDSEVVTDGPDIHLGEEEIRL